MSIIQNHLVFVKSRFDSWNPKRRESVSRSKRPSKDKYLDTLKKRFAQASKKEQGLLDTRLYGCKDRLDQMCRLVRLCQMTRSCPITVLADSSRRIRLGSRSSRDPQLGARGRLGGSTRRRGRLLDRRQARGAGGGIARGSNPASELS